jgi:hypothetical protein
MLLAKTAAASVHCTLFKKEFVPEQSLCFATLNAVHTDITFGMEIMIDLTL